MISLVKYVVIPAIKNNYGIYLLFPCLFGGMPPNKQGKTYIPCCQFLCIRSYELLCSLIYRLHRKSKIRQDRGSGENTKAKYNVAPAGISVQYGKVVILST